MRRITVLVSASALLVPAAVAAQNGAKCDPANAGIKLPSGFCATLFADSVRGARHMAFASNGDMVVVSTARGSIEVRALVTERFQPFFVDGRLIDEIGLPWHWGWAGIVPGDIANDLTASVGDPNTFIPETKVFLCSLKRKVTA